jgi:hypothetical protein
VAAGATLGGADGVGSTVGSTIGSTVGAAAVGATVGASTAVTGGGAGVAEAMSSGRDAGARRKKYQAATVVARTQLRPIAMSGTRDRVEVAARAGVRRGGVAGGRKGCSDLSGRGLSTTGLFVTLPETEGLRSASSAARSSRVGREAGAGAGATSGTGVGVSRGRGCGAGGA